MLARKTKHRKEGKGLAGHQRHAPRERSNSPENAPFEVDIERAIDAWGDDVFRLALRRTGNKVDAEDVFQNVFVKLLDAKDRITSQRHLKAWLLRTAVNSSTDVLRKRGRNAPLESCEAMREYELTAEELTLHEAVDTLSQAQRTTVHLFYFEGYRTEEIAHITGETPSTVRSHLHRARKKLKICLEDGDSDE